MRSKKFLQQKQHKSIICPEIDIEQQPVQEKITTFDF